MILPFLSALQFQSTFPNTALASNLRMIILRVTILVLDVGAVAGKEPGRPPQELLITDGSA